MGLELVEYISAIEDAFEIAIPDADVARHDTPAKLVDYLCARLDEVSDGPSLAQSAFYFLRRALVLELGVAREAIHPRTMIAELTARSENDVWKSVAARLVVSPEILTHAPAARWLAKLVHAPRRSIGDGASQLAMPHPTALKRADGGWTRSQITEVVVRLLEHETAIPIGPDQLNALFIRDLDMG